MGKNEYEKQNKTGIHKNSKTTTSNWHMQVLVTTS